MDGGPNRDAKKMMKMKKTGGKQPEVSIFSNPAQWSEQAEELYMRGEPQEAAEAGSMPIGDTRGSDSVFSMSTFSDISGSIKYAMGYSDPYGDDSYLQQDPSVVTYGDDSYLQQPSLATFGDDSYLQQPSLEPPPIGQKQGISHLYNQEYDDDDESSYQLHPRGTHQMQPLRGSRPLPEFTTTSKPTSKPKTPQRPKHEQEEHLKQQEAIHTMTPKTEFSNSENATETSAPVDQRCCGLFRRAFEEEKVFRRLIHTAVAMLIIFCMLSIFVIIRSSEVNRAKEAIGVPTMAPLKPTFLRPPSAAPVTAPTAIPSMWFPTQEPTQLTSDALKKIILQAFPGAVTAIDDPSSAQFRALAWLTSDDSMDAFFVTEKLIQRWVLAVLYYSTNGQDWRTTDKWLTNHDECDWYTADPYTPVCDDNGMVSSLHLRNNGLFGTLPDELTLLSNSLEFLYLNDGMLVGTIPSSYGKLSNLKRFYLQVNDLTGTIPAEISGMELLENLAIGRNKLTGTIPTDLVLMDELRLIDMSTNRIEGSIPTVFGQMSNLSSFIVNENRLTGTIPSEFGQLQNLISLVVQDNQLGGSVPWQVCEMKNSKTFMWLTVDCGRVDCSDECSCQCN